MVWDLFITQSTYQSRLQFQCGKAHVVLWDVRQMNLEQACSDEFTLRADAGP
jgi:hypothetical protein